MLVWARVGGGKNRNAIARNIMLKRFMPVLFDDTHSYSYHLYCEEGNESYDQEDEDDSGRVAKGRRLCSSQSWNVERIAKAYPVESGNVGWQIVRRRTVETHEIMIFLAVLVNFWSLIRNQAFLTWTAFVQPLVLNLT